MERFLNLGTQAASSANRERQASIFGAYEVLEILGRGGFGSVYLTRDPSLDRLVALKIPHRSRVTSAESGSRFLDEGRVVAQLRHANNVSVFEAG